MCPLLEKYGTFIARCSALIEKVSPCIGVHLYNPVTETVADLELQISRTFGTSHRTVSASVYSYSFYGRDSSYSLWGVAIILCFAAHCALYGAAAWRASKFSAAYRRTRSDYAWKRWEARPEGESTAPNAAVRVVEAGSCCCNFTKGILHWGTLEVISLFVQLFNCNLVVSFMAASGKTVWEEELPPADSAEDLAVRIVFQQLGPVSMLFDCMHHAPLTGRMPRCVQEDYIICCWKII
eukprot:SAG31_NODE_956_length_10790_cov_34.583107_7_plen_238_part_00